MLIVISYESLATLGHNGNFGKNNGKLMHDKIMIKLM